MIDSATLLNDLQREVSKLEDDLRARCDADTTVDAPLKAQYEAARAQKRTALTYKAWREDELTNVAVAWILACVFVRFLEDNGLVEMMHLAGPDAAGLGRARDQHEVYFRQHPNVTDREYLEHVFTQTAASPGMKEFFDRRHNPLWSVGPTGDAAAALVNFWRKANPETGRPLHDFFDPEWNTRFLGDLYQDLSEAARKRYALLQTPVFVEEFILDRTLTPAIETFGFRDVRLIDPTCGSGHFLLGGFARLHTLWMQAEPAVAPAVLAQRALEQVFGVDLNPNVVAIARFRLLLAALRATATARLRDAFDFKINVATGDALLHGRRFGEFEHQGGTQRTFDTEELFRDELKHHYEAEDGETLRRILGQQYHAVVGNPPYITVKDKAVSELYRARYPSCSGKYSLSVPFMERFFDLALSEDKPSHQRNGFVGKITSNSFMKREFAKKLIGKFFPRWDLTYVVDSSGAYIPGHGTPTVMLFGRNRPPVSLSVRTVMGIKGEPSVPPDPTQGKVWRSILDLIDHVGSENDYISVADKQQAEFHRHPWSIGGGGASEVKAAIDEAGVSDLLSHAEASGVMAIPGDDDVLIFEFREDWRRKNISPTAVRSLGEGELVRDHQFFAYYYCLFPYDAGGLFRNELSAEKHLWEYRSLLRRGICFGKTREQRGLDWREWSMLVKDKFPLRQCILYPGISTHNHFLFESGAIITKQSLPLFRIKEEIGKTGYFKLLGFLNSSSACFWMKQVCYPKERATGDISTEKCLPETNRYDFNSSAISRFPIPDLNHPLFEKVADLAARLTEYGIRAADDRPDIIFQRPDIKSKTSSELLETLRCAKQNADRERRRAVLFQEELDWVVYALLGFEEQVPFIGADVMDRSDGIEPNHRPFLLGDSSHSDPDIEKVFKQRRKILSENSAILFLETSVYKRPWLGRRGVYGHSSLTFDQQVAHASRRWLLNRLETYFFEGQRILDLPAEMLPACVGFDPATKPALSSTNQLAGCAYGDPAFLAVAEVLMGGPGFSLPKLVRELVDSASVPFLPAQRYKLSGLLKRRDWEHVWDLQRREDVIDAATRVDEPGIDDSARANRKAKAAALTRAELGDILVPPKYSSGDFKKPTWWTLRGKLDVPKERWILYPDAERTEDPSPVISWAGWDYAQQARALAEYYVDAKQNFGFVPDKLRLLLAGLLELEPWLSQWHSAVDPLIGDSPANAIRAFLDAECHALGITRTDLETVRMGS